MMRNKKAEAYHLTYTPKAEQESGFLPWQRSSGALLFNHWADACLPLGGVQTYTDFYGLVRTLATVSTAATIGKLTLVVGGVGLVGGICRQYKTLLAPHRRPLDCYRRLRTHPYPVPVGGRTPVCRSVEYRRIQTFTDWYGLWRLFQQPPLSES